MKHEIAILLLWLIAIVATMLIVRGTGLFNFLGPLLFVCMVGSLVTLVRARRDQTRRNNP
jgi:hypothetical protein